MELSEAIEILRNNQNPMLVERCKKCEHAVACLDEYMYFLALDTVLQALEELQEENKKYISGELMTRNQVKSFEETTKKYYIHKDKIKEKIEETRSEMHKFESDNANRLYLEHFNNNYHNRQSKKYGVFSTQEVITHCRLQEYVIKMGALQELLKGE